MKASLRYEIALSLIPNIGDVRAKKLVAHCGSAEAVFSEGRTALQKIPGIGEALTKDILTAKVFERAEQELQFIEKHRIIPIYFLDKAYPKRLTHCEDSPLILYYRGNADLNSSKIISIVGTRMATDYGLQLCEQLISDLAPYRPLIVSGLAYGIDLQAHRVSLDNQLETVAVMAHGLDKIYPAMHRPIAKRMLESGGLLTDFTSRTMPDRENFPRRNRIVAGMADATIVIESKRNGGSLITAEIANSYNRDVFAFPGNIGSVTSEGCNSLIKRNKASLIESAADIIYIMGWEAKQATIPVQKKLFIELSEPEHRLLDLLKERPTVHIDDLSLLAGIPVSRASALLLNLEFNGLIRSMPGKVYRLL
jgi:DNA processing protein